MLNDESIYSEVRKFVADLVETGTETPVEWIANHFLTSRGEIFGDGAALYRHCTREHIARLVKKVIGKYDAQPFGNKDEQISLEGFEYLQRAYTVSRSDKITLVPIDKMTDSELLARAAEYDEMAKGCRKHAWEIRGFVKGRTAVAA